MFVYNYACIFCRLLLWDRDNRTYSYYVEVSNDQQNWMKIADRTQDRCRSWQYIFFDARPVTFVKIVGTHNSANEVRSVVVSDWRLARGSWASQIVVRARAQQKGAAIHLASRSVVPASNVLRFCWTGGDKVYLNFLGICLVYVDFVKFICVHVSFHLCELA